MSAAEVDAYLAALDEPRRSTLEQLRSTILDVVPDAEQGMSYGSPAFTVDGKRIAGFASFATHLSYLPHSGSVTSQLAGELAGYSVSKGAFRFPVDAPLPEPLVRRLIEVRLDEVRGT